MRAACCHPGRSEQEAVARSTQKRRAVSALETPFFTNSTIFSLSSSEYALMHRRYPAHHHRNLLSECKNIDLHG
jgi:hypothetical protein